MNIYEREHVYEKMVVSTYLTTAQFYGGERAGLRSYLSNWTGVMNARIWL